MKEISVVFTSGKDVLNAYWGYLSHGGLVIRNQDGLKEGDPVSLDVQIKSAAATYRLRGRVVGSDLALGNDLVIAFHPGEPHDLLLSTAWADADNVPPRRHRRFLVSSEVSVRAHSGADGSRTDDGGHARLMNISLGGCCVRLADEGLAAAFSLGDRVWIEADHGSVEGRICRKQAGELGVQFSGVGDFEPGAEGTGVGAEDGRSVPGVIERFVKGLL